MVEKQKRQQHKWGMVVDVDKCTGCQACVVACQSENNIPINQEKDFLQKRAIQWIRIERYWEGEYPDVKARYIPILCQHCENACLLYTSPSPRDATLSRMPSSA